MHLGALRRHVHGLLLREAWLLHLGMTRLALVAVDAILGLVLHLGKCHLGICAAHMIVTMMLASAAITAAFLFAHTLAHILVVMAGVVLARTETGAHVGQVLALHEEEVADSSRADNNHAIQSRIAF